MKSKSVFLVLFLLAATALTFAAPNKTSITFSESVTVAGTTLAPGEYQVEWNGTAPDVQVTFWRYKNKVITVPAQLQAAGHRPNAFTIRPDSGANILVEIDAKNTELRFEQSVASGQ